MPNAIQTGKARNFWWAGRLFSRLALLVLLFVLDEIPSLGSSPPLAGISVLGPIERGSFLELSDIRDGDTLLSWKRFDRREPSHVVRHGRFDSPFDLIELLVEEGPRGAVMLQGLRDRKAKTWTFKAGALSLDRWRANSLPAAEGFERSRIRIAMTKIANNRLEAGISELMVLASKLEANDPIVAAWILAEAGILDPV